MEDISCGRCLRLLSLSSYCELDLFRQLKEIVLDQWENWGLEEKPSAISLIRRRSTWLGDDGKVVYYVFRKGDSFPSLIAKSTYSEKFMESIQNEAKNTKFIWENATENFRETIPRPLGLNKLNGIPVYFEEAVPGIALPEKVLSCWLSSSGKKIISTTMNNLLRWLDDFYKAFGTKKATLNSDFIGKHILNPIGIFESQNRLDSSEKRFLLRLKEKARLLEGKTINLVHLHGDLWGGSVLLGIDGRLKVIDWEFFERYGFPLQDFLYFAMHPGFIIHRSRKNGMLYEFMNLFQESFFTDIIRDYLSEQRGNYGIDSKEFIEIILALVLITLSNKRDKYNPSREKNSWFLLFRYLVANQTGCMILR